LQQRNADEQSEILHFAQNEKNGSRVNALTF
jgi:hypothetical protein